MGRFMDIKNIYDPKIIFLTMKFINVLLKCYELTSIKMTKVWLGCNVKKTKHNFAAKKRYFN